MISKFQRWCGGLASLLAASLATASDGDENPSLLLDQLASCNEAEVRLLGGLYHLADASLHLADCSSAPGAGMAEHNKIYRIVARRDLSGQRIANGGIKLLERNLGEQARQAAFDCMNSNYPDLAEGDSLSVQYQSGNGLSLWRNGSLVTHCPSGPEGAAYFVIWLGEEPLNDDLKRELTALPAD